jgi:hypothetical protein
MCGMVDLLHTEPSQLANHMLVQRRCTRLSHRGPGDTLHAALPQHRNTLDCVTAAWLIPIHDALPHLRAIA